jgi:GT2 family glycosyltransferase
MKGLTFDQVERYRGAALVLEYLRHAAAEPISDVLDIGGFFKTLAGTPLLPCQLLLKDCKCKVVDTADVELPGYSQISPDQPLPFDDESFVMTICMDVFEHIQPGKHIAFLDEVLRVTSGALVLGAPFYHEARASADRWLAHYSTLLLNAVNPMLKEHLENGLPDKGVFVSALNERNLRYMSFTNGDLARWRLVMAVKHLLQLSSGPDTAMDFEYDLLPWADPVSISQPGYRDMYVIYKNLEWREEHLIEGVKTVSKALQDNMPEKTGDMIAVVCRYLEFAGKTIAGLNTLQYERRLIEKRLRRDVQVLQKELDRFQIQTRQLKLQTRQLELSIREKNTGIDYLIKQAENRDREMEKHIREYERGFRELRQSASFRLGQAILAPLKSVVKPFRKTSDPTDREPMETLLPEEDKSEQQDSRIQFLEHKPLFSILVPVYSPDELILRATLDSVVNQSYPFWELCLVDDASPDEEPRRIIREYAQHDPQRVRFHFSKKNGGIAVASNQAARMAQGEFVCLLDHDDLLDPDALMEIAMQLQVVPDTDYFYSDEDKVHYDGSQYCQPYFKPDYDPDLLLCNNYLNHFSVIRRSLFEGTGGFREGFDGSQDYDLYLRVTEQACRIVHIPKILYHWRMVPESTAVDPEAKGGLYRESSIKALQAAIERRGLKATIENGLSPGSYRVRYHIENPRKVCLIIPTRNAVDLLDTCISSIEKYTDYPDYEILVVDNNSDDDLLTVFLDKKKIQNKAFRVVQYPGRFNFSAINNFAVTQTDAAYFLFLNNDIEVSQRGWLTAMMEHGQRHDIGAVGAKLLYPDGLIQHAGVILGMGGIAGHPFKGMPENKGVYFGHSDMVKNYSAVTAACMLTRRDVFEDVGGFNEELAVSFGDIDLCMEIRRKGYRIVYTPYARLIHHESISRLDDNDPVRRPRFHAEITYMLTKWGNTLFEDPCLNPNLSILEYDMRLRSAVENETLENFRKAFSGFIPSMEEFLF